MNLRALLATLALAFATLASAIDYELLVGQGWGTLKEAETLVLSDPSGRLKKGDRIVRVRAGVRNAGGTVVTLSPGAGAGLPQLSTVGSVEGFKGRIVFQSVEGPGIRVAIAPLLGSIPVPQKPEAPSTIARILEGLKAVPWGHLLMLVGVAVLILTCVVLMRREPSQRPIAISFSGRGKDVQDALRELRSQVEHVLHVQNSLVKKPPVLRSFKRDIENFDQRLKKLEGLAQTDQQTLASLISTISGLEEKLSVIAGQCAESIAQNKKTSDSVQRFATASEQAAAAVEKRHAEVRAALDAISTLPPRVEAVDKRVDDLSRNLAGLASQVAEQGKRLDEASKDFVKRVEAMQGSHEGLKGAIGEIGKALQAMRGSIEGVNASVESVRGSVDGVQGALNSFASLSEALDGVRAHVEASAGADSSLLKELNALQAGLAEVRSDLLASREESVKRLESLESRSGNLEASVAKAHASMAETLEARSGALQEIVAQAQETMAKTLEARSGALEESLAQAQAKMADAVKSEADNLRNAIESMPAPVQQVIQVIEPAKEQEAPVQPKVDEKPTLEVVEAEPQGKNGKKKDAPEATANKRPNFVNVSVKELEADSWDEDDIEVGPGLTSRIDRWTGPGGSVARRWSIELPQLKGALKTGGSIKALRPIETPSANFPIGAMLYTGSAIVYAHGDTVRAFWPGSEDSSIELAAPLPNDDWRLMLFGGYLYCVQERQVQIIHLGLFRQHSHFDGDYLAQAHTDAHWAGLMSWGGQLAIDFRDTGGNHVGSPRTIEANVFDGGMLAAWENKVYVATRAGALFGVDLLGSTKLLEPNADSATVGLAASKSGIFLVQQRSDGAYAFLVVREGQVKELFLGESPLARPPVLIGDRFYAFSGGELIQGSLKTLQITDRAPIEGVSNVHRMVGLRAGKSHLLGIIASDADNMPTQALVYDIKTGHKADLGFLNVTDAELLVAGGHFAVATSCSYQNTLSVFSPFKAEEERKAA